VGFWDKTEEEASIAVVVARFFRLLEYLDVDGEDQQQWVGSIREIAGISCILG
jgi:hypothetical protein